MKYERTLYSSGAPLEEKAGYSRAIRLGNFVFVGGTTAVQADGSVFAEGDAYAQTKYILEKMESYYLEAGARREDVYRVKMYVTDISKAKEVITAYSEFYKPIKPLATMVETPKLNRPSQVIEIEIEALIGSATKKVTEDRQDPSRRTAAQVVGLRYLAESYERSIEWFREAQILLPTLSQLADPSTIPGAVQGALAKVDQNEAHPLNLFRLHWYNALDYPWRVGVPEHIVLPKELTGVDARIVLVLGNRFPMVSCHKVLAAYACLVPRIVSGQFDPSRHRAVWPSTGNYARGGIAISRLMRCRGVAVLPENMSRERFDWLERQVDNPDDIIRTPGSESNVKEIYDACHELGRDPANFIVNQFCEFGNHLAHYQVSGAAFAQVFNSMQKKEPGLALSAFVAASGSAGTLGAGDRLKDDFGAKIVAVEALECPTMLYNGYGEHNIQGIGDKHIPLIHNVMNTDLVAAVSDRATDGLNLVFNTEAGRAFLREQMGVDPAVVEKLRHLGLSSIANMLGAIKTAQKLNLGAQDVVISVATDGAELYNSEKEKLLAQSYPAGFDDTHAAEIAARHLAGMGTEHIEELDEVSRNRIFNLGYFTWVEQQGISAEDFEIRRSPAFWKELHEMGADWDEMIGEFNKRTGVTIG